MAFSSLDLYYLVKELQDLINGKISQIYQPEKHVIIFEIYSSKTGKKFLRFNVSSSLELTDQKESIEKPLNFCMYLR
jgi:predicted ribosome quality control (RQC) complex YloA/Tae2 family protein